MRSRFQMCSVTGIAMLAAAACAQSYPVKPVRILVGFSAGGGTDVTARMLAQKLSEYLGQPVIVENRAGSGGMIATEAVSKSPADGYTLLMVAAADVVQPAMRAKLSYDLERDFTPISNVVVVPFALVTHPSVPARNVKELIALARTSPGRLNYASSGIGSSAHLSNELFNSMAKVNITHVPYKGVAEGVTALAGGQIEMIFGSFPATIPLYQARRIRMLAVSTLKRTSVMPELPTVSEAGVPGYDRYGWYGVIAPAGVGKDVIARLNAGIVKVTATPEMREMFTRQGLDPQTNSPEQFGAFIHSELVQTAKLIKESGAQAN